MPERLLVIATLIVVVGIPAGITWAKGQYAAFSLGFVLLGMVWLVAACRLARPESWWARRFYGPEKLQLAVDRFGSDASTVVTIERDPMRSRRIRVAYLATAALAFGLSLVDGHAFFIAMSSFLLIVSLLGALIATRQERKEG